MDSEFVRQALTKLSMTEAGVIFMSGDCDGAKSRLLPRSAQMLQFSICGSNPPWFFLRLSD